jgi:hypothetical protein
MKYLNARKGIYVCLAFNGAAKGTVIVVAHEDQVTL